MLRPWFSFVRSAARPHHSPLRAMGALAADRRELANVSRGPHGEAHGSPPAPPGCRRRICEGSVTRPEGGSAWTSLGAVRVPDRHIVAADPSGAAAALRAPDARCRRFRDRISLVDPRDDAWALPLTVDMASVTDAVPVSATAPGCPVAGLRGFSAGTRALVMAYECRWRGARLLQVTGIAGALFTRRAEPPSTGPTPQDARSSFPSFSASDYFDRI